MKKMLKTGFIVLFIVLCLFFAIYPKEFYLKQFMFDDNKALNKWCRMVLNGESEYRLMKRGDNGYIWSHSEKACSALYYRIGFNINNYPLLSWKWQVLKFPDTSRSTTEKEKDDYAARVYVIFPFLNFSSSKFIEYVWAKDIPVGKIMDSPSGRNVKVIVARSGKTAENEWVFECRNIYDDYIKAFGRKPKMSAGAIAIMCDSDNTKSSAESVFDDIVIQSETKFAERSEKK